MRQGSKRFLRTRLWNILKSPFKSVIANMIIRFLPCLFPFDINIRRLTDLYEITCYGNIFWTEDHVVITLSFLSFDCGSWEWINLSTLIKLYTNIVACIFDMFFSKSFLYISIKCTIELYYQMHWIFMRINRDIIESRYRRKTSFLKTECLHSRYLKQGFTGICIWLSNIL